MTPITDPRPLPAALSDWMARHGLSAYAAAPILGAHQSTVRRWIDGVQCDRERGVRATMTLYDQGWRP
jgi:transposase